MYKGLELMGSDGPIKIKSSEFILNTRAKFNIFFENLEEYISKNDVIIADKISLYLVLGNEKDIDSYHYTLYSQYPEKHAMNIGKIFYDIAPEDLSRYTHIETKIPRIIYNVWVNNRSLVTIIGIRDITLTKPIEFKGLFNPEINVKTIDPGLLLIQQYQVLSNPALASCWEETLLIIDKLKTLVDKMSWSSIIEGGKDDKTSKKTDDKINMFKNEVIHKFTNRTSSEQRVLIGSYAIYDVLRQSLLTKQFSKARIQIISTVDHERDSAEILEIANKHDIQIDIKIQDPSLPLDRRLRKMTVNVKKGSKYYSMIDIFNNGTYELIPFTISDDGLRIGHSYVLLRHFLIDLWLIKIYKKIESLDINIINILIGNLVKNFKFVDGNFDKTLLQRNEDYAGKYIDELLSLRRVSKKYFTPYKFFIE